MKTYKFVINDQKYKTRILEYKGDNIMVEVNGIEYRVELQSDIMSSTPRLVRSEKPKTNVKKAVHVDHSSNSTGVKAPIPGLVHTLLVKEGDKIEKGQPLLILEAMKMESEIASSSSGTVTRILVKEGESIQEGQTLIEIGE